MIPNPADAVGGAGGGGERADTSLPDLLPIEFAVADCLPELKEGAPARDGRVARGQRTRRNVAVAMMDLLREGDPEPTAQAVADMKTFPHAECMAIQPKFGELIGLSVARGYTSAVQERFGRERGCSHLEFLARALGPAVVQAVTSTAAWQVERGEPYPARERGLTFLSNTCHVWIEGGEGEKKVATGWRPGMFGYPAPSVSEIRRRMAAAPDARAAGRGQNA